MLFSCPPGSCPLQLAASRPSGSMSGPEQAPAADPHGATAHRHRGASPQRRRRRRGAGGHPGMSWRVCEPYHVLVSPQRAMNGPATESCVTGYRRGREAAPRVARATFQLGDNRRSNWATTSEWSGLTVPTSGRSGHQMGADFCQRRGGAGRPQNVSGCSSVLGLVRVHVGPRDCSATRYLAALRGRLRAGKADRIEVLLWQYQFGKPKEVEASSERLPILFVSRFGAPGVRSAGDPAAEGADRHGRRLSRNASNANRHRQGINPGRASGSGGGRAGGRVRDLISPHAAEVKPCSRPLRRDSSRAHP
jgi:hypothetical protein